LKETIDYTPRLWLGAQPTLIDHTALSIARFTATVENDSNQVAFPGLSGSDGSGRGEMVKLEALARPESQA
jgi:hypothetical protein